jgi:hypothetical protein
MEAAQLPPVSAPTSALNLPSFTRVIEWARKSISNLLLMSGTSLGIQERCQSAAASFQTPRAAFTISSKMRPKTPDSNRVKTSHVSRLMPHELLRVSLDLFGVIEIVIEPFMKQLTYTNKPDLRVHSRVLQIGRRQLVYKLDTSFSCGGKLVEQLENVLIAVVSFERYFVLIVELEPWVFLTKY